MNEHLAKLMLEQIGELRRRVLQIEEALGPSGYDALPDLPFSGVDDIRVDDSGLPMGIIDALRRKNIFTMSQILNLGKRYLDETIGPMMTMEIKNHLADMGVPLQT